MPVQCRECHCRDTRVRETTRRRVSFRGKKYLYTERVVWCRHCGVTFRDVVEEDPDDDSIKTD